MITIQSRCCHLIAATIGVLSALASANAKAQQTQPGTPSDAAYQVYGPQQPYGTQTNPLRPAAPAPPATNSPQYISPNYRTPPAAGAYGGVAPLSQGYGGYPNASQYQAVPSLNTQPQTAQAYAQQQYIPMYEPPKALQEASWTYIPPPPVRTFKLHDIVSIRVDEIARMQAEGSAQSRKNSLYDALLNDWIKLRDGKLQPDFQQAGDPRVQGSLNSLYRADSDIQSRESLSFNIAARIVDIRPNGTLVLEAHKTIFVNENAWETYLSGTCRPVDIGPDNVVLSRDLLDLQIRKNERGRLRDGYRRGWFQRWFETLQPF